MVLVVSSRDGRRNKRKIDWTGTATKLGYQCVEIMVRDLYRVHDNINDAAKAASVSPSSFLAKMKEFGIARKQPGKLKKYRTCHLCQGTGKVLLEVVDGHQANNRSRQGASGKGR